MIDVCIVGDCRDSMRKMIADGVRVQTCVTSPPYWGLRSYLPNEHEDKGIEIGLESTPEEYVANMVSVFRLVRDLLADDGTLWLNLGDSYANVSSGSTNYNEGFNERSGNASGQRKQETQGKVGVPKTVPPGLKPKDLVGIPWRVAFALQQPYEKPHCIKHELDRAWMAALVDGEGCISIRRYDSHSNGLAEARCQDGFVPFVSIGNNDRELLDRCVQITGYGSVGVKDRPDVDSRGIKSRRTYYGWRLDGNKAMDVIRDIYPFLIAKRKQAIICHNLDLSNKRGKELRGNGPLPADEQQRREVMKTLTNACNQRAPVDIPSWMVDVTRAVEPGWYLRSDIIWSKPNPMPESVTDRCTKSHEYLFMLAKRERYFYDADAIKENSSELTHMRRADLKNTSGAIARSSRDVCPVGNGNDGLGAYADGATRNRRTVWTVATEPYAEAHFATFPRALIEPCILAGSSQKGHCPACGKGWVREIERSKFTEESIAPKAKVLDGIQRKDGGRNLGGRQFNEFKAANPDKTLGWQPSCDCRDTSRNWQNVPLDPVPGIVFDPFLGSGTTAQVAQDLGRHWLACELNPDYALLQKNRTRQQGLALA